MEKRPFISVVMPVYNVEKYLRQAIDSVLKQSFQDFELILVDDCSPDNCSAICEEYAQKERKIRVIHHVENQGLSMARNNGMELAQGRYIWFMDSDDCVDLDLFQEAYNSVEKNEAQVIVFGLVEEYFDEQGKLHHVHSIIPEGKLLKSQQEVRKNIIDLEMQTLYGYAWNKFYMVDYLKNIKLQYEKITLIEDILFNVNYFMDISTLNILPIAPYHYAKRMENSLTAKFVPDYYQLHKKRIELLYDQHMYWEICNDTIKGTLAMLYARYIFSALQRNCDIRSEMSHKERKKWMKQVFQDEIFQKVIVYGNADSLILKIMIFLLQHRMTLSCVILGRIIFIVKNKLPMVFSIVKQKR